MFSCFGNFNVVKKVYAAFAQVFLIFFVTCLEILLLNMFYKKKYLQTLGKSFTRVSFRWQQYFCSSPRMRCCWPRAFPVFVSCDRQCKRLRRNGRIVPKIFELMMSFCHQCNQIYR